MADSSSQASEILELVETTYFSAYRSGLIQKIDSNGLTFLHRSILLFILKHNGCKMKDVCNGLAISPPALTRMVDKLVHENLVKREMREEERRALFLFITDKGKKMVKDFQAKQVDNVALMIKKLSRQEIAAVKEGLSTLLKMTM